jgi:hypothetical protein
MAEAVHEAPDGPEIKDDRPLFSIVVPAADERLTIGEFVDWCFEGLRRAGVDGEVIIVDSSSDETADIAESRGARVLRRPKQGVGRALIEAIPHVRGRYVLMGDCDLTYDFRELTPFVQAINEGYDFVLGTRFLGQIERGAMPRLHRYFGSPLTTWIFNVIYGTRFSDIHSGMRAIRSEDLQQMNLRSQSWDWASEMLSKATKMRLKTIEVPIRFYKDRPGRESHMKRSGRLEPWKAGWVNLRAMCLYSPEFFLLMPGALMLIVGLLLALLPLCGGAIGLGPVGLGQYPLLLGLPLAAVGYMAVGLGLIAKVYYNFDPPCTTRVLRRWSFNRGATTAAVLAVAGLALGLGALAAGLSGRGGAGSCVVLDAILLMLGFQTFALTLVLHAVEPGRQRQE